MTIDAIVVQCLAKLVCFKKIAFNKTGAVNNGAAMTFGKIVVDHNFVAVVYQFFRDDTADVSRAARYQNTHAFPLEKFKTGLTGYEQDLQDPSPVNLV